MDICDLIVENIDNPHELESVYQKDPEAFKKALACARDQNPDSKVLAVWHERLHFREPAKTQKCSLLQKDFVSMVILAIIAGISARIILYFVEQQTMAPINLIFGVVPFMAAYFCMQQNHQKKHTLHPRIVIPNHRRVS